MCRCIFLGVCRALWLQVSPAWVPPGGGGADFLCVLTFLPEKRQTGTDHRVAVPHAINQLIAFGIQSSGFISCQPARAISEHGWNDPCPKLASWPVWADWTGISVIRFLSAPIHIHIRSQSPPILFSMLHRRAENSDELDPPFKWTWNEITHTNNLPPWFIIISHLCGRGEAGSTRGNNLHGD